MVLVVVAVVAVVGGAVLLFVTSRDSDEDGGDPPTVELSTEEQDYAGAIADSGGRDLAIDDAMAQCFGAATVDVVGIDVLRGAVTLDELRYGTFDSLREFGVTLDEPQVAELARRYDECGDWVDVLIETWAQTEATPETLECFRENVNQETLAYLAAASFAGTQELSDSVEQSAEEVSQLCVPVADGLGG